MLTWIALLMLLPCLGVLLRLRRAARRVRALALVLAVGAGAAGSAQLATGGAEPPGRMVVAADGLHLRTCPDTACGSLGVLSRGTEVAVREARGVWVRVGAPADAACAGGESGLVQTGRRACRPDNGIENGRVAPWVHSGHLAPAPGGTGASVR
ncbi:SH3 domain-containing protein [Wenxinia marina]|uniref:SH3 domain-containing protein n=1 Tax=Wenxinia marina TaxID=390641 RepID=UPI00035F649D|nr:SH3 domain-containing protein [Wenxinia marina]GGL70138.1 hypothetical protein GCM10011392_25870 [Wenxinia marina]